MFWRTVDDPEDFWGYVQDGMVHIPREYNPVECPLMGSALERLSRGTSKVMLVIGQTHAHHVGKLACPTVNLAAHYWHWTNHDIVIDFVLMSIPYTKTGVRPWIVLDWLSDWWRLQQKHGNRVSIGFPPEVPQEHMALNLFWQTAYGTSQRRVIDGQYLTLYPLSDRWFDSLATAMINASDLSENEKKRELFWYTTRSKQH